MINEYGPCISAFFQVEDFQNDAVFALWGGPNSCDVSVDWIVEGSCGFIEDSGCSVHLEHDITVDLSPLKSPTFWIIKDPSTNKSYEVRKCLINCSHEILSFF